MDEGARWLEMARESLIATDAALGVAAWRPAASRAYYAAYQAATAMLIHAGATPPKVSQGSREAWHHAAMAGLLQRNMKSLMRNRTIRDRIATELMEMFKVRILADYHTQPLVTQNQARTARRQAGFMVRTATQILKG